MEESLWVLVTAGLTEGEQVHWQAGQGDRERRGGEEGLGLGQCDPEGDTGGRVDKEIGETERVEAASWVPKDSLLRETVTEGEALPDGEEGMGETGVVMVWLEVADEGTRLVGVVAGLEGAVV